MKIGDVVVVCGLRQAAQWNGCIGEITAKHDDEDRWIVVLKESGKVGS